MTPLSKFGFNQTQWEFGQHGPLDGKWRIVCGTQVIAEAGDRRHAFLIACAPQLYEALDALCSSLSEQDDEGLIEHAPQMLAARNVIARLHDGIRGGRTSTLPDSPEPA